MTEYQQIIETILGKWGWLIAAAIGSVAFKDAVSKFWQGLMFLVGNDFNVDDIVYINGVKKARIVRQSVYKTVFYVYDHHRKFIVPNDRIWTLNIEKSLPKERENKL
jgi:hypothetical protein